jgi:hypothetical protein
VAYCSEHKSADQDGYRIALACYIVTARRTDVKLVPSIAVTAVQTRSSDPRFRRITLCPVALMTFSERVWKCAPPLACFVISGNSIIKVPQGLRHSERR